MLGESRQIRGLKLRARDGEIGKVKDFYFDDEHWTIRYLVADTGGWLTGRKVLISPYSLSVTQPADGVVPINLTKAQIEESPSIETDAPVSRQFERTYSAYHHSPQYWVGPHIWGASLYPYPETTAAPIHPPEGSAEERGGDPHLRSTTEVSGYGFHGQDGDIGHVEDFLIDDQTWSIRYVVVDTRNWWPGKKVLVSPGWIGEIQWNTGRVFVDLSRSAIKGAPEYVDGMAITRDYEARLHGHYRRESYWNTQPDAEQRFTAFV